MIQAANFVGRNHLGTLLNYYSLVGTGVEIGTHRGVFANDFLHVWNGKKLYCVDPWSTPPGYEQQAKVLIKGMRGAPTREEDMRETIRLLNSNNHEGRYELIRATSVEAANRFGDGTLHFVHVDGDHRREHVTQDLCLWYEKLACGGILSGHDFISPGEPGGGDAADVQPAVLEFADSKERDVFIIHEPISQPWSYYIRK